MSTNMEAIVLRAIVYRDKDLILEALTNNLGKISFYAPRQRSTGKPGPSRLEIFDSGHLELADKRGELFTLKYFKSHSSFPQLRSSLDKLTLASFLCEATSLTLPAENESDSNLYNELILALQAISIADQIKDQLKQTYLFFSLLLTHSGLIVADNFALPSLKNLQKLIAIAEQHVEQRFQSRIGLEQVFRRCRTAQIEAVQLNS